VASSPPVVVSLSVLFALTAMVGGILLALGASIPISPYVTTISFLLYLGCRIVGARRRPRGARLHWAR
jgi:zinc/manganese transport system permease protein